MNVKFSGIRYLTIFVLTLVASDVSSAQNAIHKPIDYLAKPKRKNISAGLKLPQIEQMLKAENTSIEDLNKKYPLVTDQEFLLKYRTQRLQRFRDDVAKSFELNGMTKAKWADDARAAIECYCHYRVQYRVIIEQGVYFQEFQDQVAKTIKAGCDDPMIVFWHERFQERELPEIKDPKKLIQALKKLCDSQYSTISKAIMANNAWGRLFNQSRSKNSSDLSEEVKISRELFETNLKSALTESNQVDYEHYFLLLLSKFKILSKSDSANLTKYWREIDQQLADHKKLQWLRSLLEAHMLHDWAWQARGTGFADSVTKEGHELFQKRMAQAETKLTESWKLDNRLPYAPILLIGVATALSHERATMEKWFQTAIRIDPDLNEAYYAKLNYLQPNWYGTVADYLGFIYQCWLSEETFTSIPLIFEKANGTPPNDPKLWDQYYSNPQVLNHYTFATMQHLSRYPNDRYLLTKSLWMALKAKQWDTVLTYHSYLDERNPWPGFFRSYDEYKKIIADAEKQAEGKP